MSEAKHTPGPWYVRTNRHPETDGRPWGWLDAKPPGSGQNAIPGVSVTWTRGERSEANARLIAAAPDMLEKLQYAVEILSAEGYDVAPIRETIAKATGGAA